MHTVRSWARIFEGAATVIAAPSLAAAWIHLESARRRADWFRFVLLDLSLPDGDGLDLLPRLAEIIPRPEVAVLTDRLDAPLMVRLHGACTIAVPKPADRDTLMGILAILEARARCDSTLERFARVHRLSPQENKLLTLAVQEIPNKQTADELGCGECTIRTYWHRIFAKVGCTTQRDLIARLFRFAEDSANIGPPEGRTERLEP